ncbi:MAG TPA: SpoIVB peptidase S55 domain-containing protein, partial [Pyrinomonadaceae bacterium]|nr:SpoIVB peptidase S55 domain-containing protein [Pyrinomonadaceae bacterium]
MINTRTSLFFLILFALSMPIFGQSAGTSAASSAGGSKYLPLTEVREGMKGTAMTVFRGSEPEEFDVEILGVLPGGVGPNQDLIIGRIGGGLANRTAVFAGMSGSPVYVNGKLIGAISYSFPFSKEAICGITPIEQMISIFEERPRSTTENREPVPVSFAEIASATYEMRLPQQMPASSPVVAAGSGSMLQAVAGQSFRRIGTPLTFTGIAQSTLDLFAPQLMQAGLIPVAAAGGSAKITPMKKADANTLKGGASVSMMLTRGDYSLAAAGTVTMRDGDKVYAFGHPFLSLGTSDLTMSESSVIT